jgi:hypothetical protein
MLPKKVIPGPQHTGNVAAKFAEGIMDRFTTDHFKLLLARRSEPDMTSHKISGSGQMNPGH